MGTKVNLPPGCSGITCRDGTQYNGTKGGSVEIEDRHASYLEKSKGVSSQMLSIGPGIQIGTKKGRWCAECKRIWQAWSKQCPRCNGPTEES